MLARDDKVPPRHYEAARIELRCRVTAAHARQLMLAQTTIYTDGGPAGSRMALCTSAISRSAVAVTHRRSAHYTIGRRHEAPGGWVVAPLAGGVSAA